jgi:hypothetical protein
VTETGPIGFLEGIYISPVLLCILGFGEPAAVASLVYAPVFGPAKTTI